VSSEKGVPFFWTLFPNVKRRMVICRRDLAYIGIQKFFKERGDFFKNWLSERASWGKLVSQYA